MVPAATVTALLGAMVRLGLDVRALRSAIGPFAQGAADEAFEALWSAVRHLWAGDDLELAIAGMLPAGAFGPFDLSALTAPSVGAACQVFAHTLPAIAGEGVVLTMMPQVGGAMRVRLLNGTPANVARSATRWCSPVWSRGFDNRRTQR